MSNKLVIAIDKMGGVLEDKDTFIENGMEKESARRYVRKLLLRIAEINKVLNNKSIHKVPEYNKLCALKAERDSAFEEAWKIYTEYHNIIIQEPKTIGNMTAEELAEVLKAVNANRPQQTMNFNAPIGQQIAHVDKIEAHFDKDMGMQITNAEELSANSSDKGNESIIEEKPGSAKPSRGRKKIELFINEEDAEAAASAFKKLLQDSNLTGKNWTSSKNDSITPLLVSFRKQWLGKIDPNAKGTALVDFAIDRCGVQTEVDRNSLSNVIRRLL